MTESVSVKLVLLNHECCRAVTFSHGAGFNAANERAKCKAAFSSSPCPPLTLELTLSTHAIFLNALMLLINQLWTTVILT